MTLDISLSPEAEKRLRERAAEKGVDVKDCAKALLEEILTTRPSADELLAPFRRQVAESGMSDEELDEFYRAALRDVRTKRAARTL